MNDINYSPQEVRDIIKTILEEIQDDLKTMYGKTYALQDNSEKVRARIFLNDIMTNIQVIYEREVKP